MSEPTTALDVAIRLLMETIPHLDLAVSEHNDGVRLLRDIVMFLAGFGYPGFLEDRQSLGNASSTRMQQLVEQEAMRMPPFRKVRQG